VRELSVEDWLGELASESPTPGGGGAAGLIASTGAALVSMVCNLTIGKPKYAEHEEVLRRVLAEAGELRAAALELAEQDARAFDAVIAAYRLPRESEDQKAQRTAAIQAALLGAADVPLRTARLSADVIKLAAEIVDRSNVNVLSDVAVAAAAAVAALRAAKINVAVNLSGIEDAQARERLASALQEYLTAAERGEAVIAEVERRLGR
jgi:formiminotetrahydrofolate cyclodeaminase